LHSDKIFDNDVALLISHVEEIVGPPPPLRRGFWLMAGLLLLVAAGSFISVGRTFNEYPPILISDAVVAVALAGVGIGILAASTRPWLAVGGGILLGVWPFIGLRMWWSAEVRGAFGWGSLAIPLLAIMVALGLVVFLLAVDPDVRFGYQRPSGRAGLMLIHLGALAPVGLSLVGSTIPTSDAERGTLRFSNPMVLTCSVLLAFLVIITQGVLQGAILAGWAGGAAFVLANTVWLRSHSEPALVPILNAQLLLSGFTVTILVATAILALRGDRFAAAGAGVRSAHEASWPGLP